MAIITRVGSEVLSVKRVTVVHNDPAEDYKMTGRPRGKCLIVNNINFVDEIFPTRWGSDEDAQRFDEIFRQLGFEIVMRRDLTSDQMRATFKKVAASCRPEDDAVFVFILSHGSEYGVYGTDGLLVYLNSEIINCFDNRNCKAMIGKPKVLVIQACRGRAKDCGGEGDTIDSMALDGLNHAASRNELTREDLVPAASCPPAAHQQQQQQQELAHQRERRKYPVLTDMLVVFSCLKGFVSVRNEASGSWLGVALAYFIMTQAHERDFLRILNLVASDIIQRESTNGITQSVELRLFGWTKNLYFNPGFYL